MLETDGYELVHRLRTLAPHKRGCLPALALAAYARPEDGARSQRVGFQAHLPKLGSKAWLRTVASHPG